MGTIFMIFASMIVGIIIGHFRLIPNNQMSKMHHFILISLIGMLFALGAQVGSDPDVLGKLGQIGWKSFVIAMLSMIGSALALLAMDKIWPIHIQGEDDKI